MSDESSQSIPTVPPESATGEPTLAAVHGSRGIEHPTKVGKYQIVSILGEGGMGVVYEARQTHPVTRTVALKLIKLGRDTRQIVARFDGERQALAMMDHPNVARVFDAGADDFGRPYFVMEYVPGEPITSYCDRHRLTAARRLELFNQACAAVQHAHQKGIIHRDLKPGNLLVHEVDGKPVVKVIDFGLAKAMHQGAAERSLATEAGQLLGTPEYLSPEQAQNSETRVDTRTDVYALGVILYELITGLLPWDPGSLRTGSEADIQRTIREFDPPRPSARLSHTPQTIARAATARSTEPTALLRSLRNDLDWVVMKAIEKEPERRYSSVSELAGDVDRFLRHEPVSAGPPTAAYRLRKFIRRNRFTVAAASAVCAALVIGAVGMTWQAIRATRAERAARQAQKVAEEQRAAAESNAATITAVNDFLSQMLGAVDPAYAQGREVTVREVLAQAARNIEQGLKGQPAVEARLRLTIGRTYRALGKSEEALPHLRRAHELAAAQWGEDSETALLALDHLGAIHSERGEFAKAEPILRTQVELSRKRHGAAGTDTLYAMNSLATCLQSQDRFAEAEPIFRAVVDGMRRDPAASQSDLAIIQSNLAFLLAQLDQLDEAEPMLRQSLAAQEKQLGQDHPATLVTGNNLALVLQKRGKLAESVEVYRALLARSVRVNGQEHPSTWRATANLGNALRLVGNYAEAESQLRAALKGQEQVFGAAAPPTLETSHNLSQVLLTVGRSDEAIDLARQSFDVMCRQVDPASVSSLRVRLRYAVILISLKQYADAEPIAREALRLGESVLKPTSPMLAQIRAALADSLEGQGKLDEASRVRPTTNPATQPK